MISNANSTILKMSEISETLDINTAPGQFHASLKKNVIPKCKMTFVGFGIDGKMQKNFQ